jgi:hypothetical protein
MTTETTESNDSTVSTAVIEETVTHTPVGADATREELLKRYETAVADNARYRDRLRQSEKDKEAKDSEVAAHLEAKTQAEQRANERVAKADFRARLRSAGIDDPDVLKLVDLSPIKYDEDGEPTNADEIWAQFQEAKSYLFAGKAAVDTSTSSIKTAPSQKEETFDWMTATAEQISAHRKLLRKTS